MGMCIFSVHQEMPLWRTSIKNRRDTGIWIGLGYCAPRIGEERRDFNLKIGMSPLVVHLPVVTCYFSESNRERKRANIIEMSTLLLLLRRRNYLRILSIHCCKWSSRSCDTLTNHVWLDVSRAFRKETSTVSSCYWLPTLRLLPGLLCGLTLG